MRRFVPGLVLFLAACSARAQGADWRARLTEAIGRAVARNPEVAAMESRIDAARYRVGQSAALPDPQLDLELRDFPVSHFSLSRDEMTAEVIGLQQAFPGAGKRPARRAVAEADVAAASAAHEDHRVRLAAEVADVYFTIGEIDGKTAILEQSRDRLRRSASAAAERYRVGKGALADVLRADLDATAAEERLVALRGERRMAAARWNALQALPPGEPVAAADLPPDDPSPALEAELAARAEEASPAVAARLAEIGRAEGEVSLAHAEGRPDFNAMAYYAHRIDYESLAGLGVSVSLPFVQGGRLADRRAEADAGLSGARANLELVRNGIRGGVAVAAAELDRSIEQARLYRGSILPQAETTAQAAEQAYTVGQVDFLTYSRAALDLESYSGELVARRAAAWRALAALQTASGLPLVPGTPGWEGSHE